MKTIDISWMFALIILVIITLPFVALYNLSSTESNPTLTQVANICDIAKIQYNAVKVIVIGADETRIELECR